MKILYINNNGGGFADHVEITENTTIERFFDINMPDAEPSDYLIRVNRQPVARDYILQPNDRVTITPVNIDGGRHCKHNPV